MRMLESQYKTKNYKNIFLAFYKQYKIIRKALAQLKSNSKRASKDSSGTGDFSLKWPPRPMHAD